MGKTPDVEVSDSSFPELAVARMSFVYMYCLVGDVHRRTDKIALTQENRCVRGEVFGQLRKLMKLGKD